ncbi:SatD family protein [Nocardioides sp.]|uniref:SatD family protein n=1 Tax=Nocardioides sp. TaxID=35761 RepID=UPI002621D4A2|nr:SatD family protein [Nocardioides sp.]
MVIACIGDVVASREVQDRGDLNRRVGQALAEVNAAEGRWRPITPLRITAGDEFQGVFATLGAAVRATLRVRLALTPYDVRFGIGRGDVTVLSEQPRVEDGSAWWAARQAIEAAEAAQRRAATRSVRVTYAIDPDGATDPAVAAALVTRDELLGRLDDRDLSVLSGMLAGMSQDAIAAQEGISPSAVSQRVRRGGLAALAASDAYLGELE